MAEALSLTMPTTRAFHILAEIKAYPATQALDVRLRQLRPDIVLLDLATDLNKACEIIEFIAAFRPPILVVGLHHRNEPDAILRSLRSGSTEFLYSPFDVDMQREAFGRLAKLRQPSAQGPTERGKLVA
ncbi:MAG: hypothetical protein ACRD96_16920, partial [Bryobacteraceae bacterium]